MYKYLNEHRKTPAKRSARSDSTGLPAAVKSRLAAASGLSFDDVRIHYNSEKPAALRAYAYTQEPDVYIAPGQERHLFHELGHVIQQKREPVAPTGTINGVPINDDPALEKAADTMVSDHTNNASGYLPTQCDPQHSTAQCSPRHSAVQRKPWHSDVNFPRNQLDCDNQIPTTPITGYAFVGYTYPTRNTLSAADQTGAITAAAELIGGLPTPKFNELVSAKDIKNELKQKNNDPSAKGTADASQDAEAFAKVDEVLASTPADAPPDSIISDILHTLPKYVISELLPPEILDHLAFFSRLETICSNNTDKDTALGLIMADADYNDDNFLPGKLRTQIESSQSVKAITNILNHGLRSFYSKEYNEYEKGARKNRGQAPRNTGDKIDPFHIEVKTAYPDTTRANILNLHYQFSNESYGYVVEIEKNTETYRMQNRGSRDTIPPRLLRQCTRHRRQRQ